MELETAKRLHDAVFACDELQAFAAGRSRAQCLEDRGLQLVVWKLIEIVGEALPKAEVTEPSLSKQIPELPDVVMEDVEPLRNRLSALLQEVPAPGHDRGE